MVKRRLSEVSISGVTVHEASGAGSSGELISWSVERNFGKPIAMARLDFTKNLTNLVPIKEGQEIIISGGFSTSTDETLFRGEVQAFEPKAGKIVVKAVDRLYQAVRNTINAKIYDKDEVGNEINPDGLISDAFKDIVTDFANLNATSSTITNTSGAQITPLVKFIADHTDPKERLDRLAEAMGWIYYYDPTDDNVYFQPKQTTFNSGSLVVGDNVLNVPTWKYSKDDLINDLRVDGAFQDAHLEDLFSGDGVTTDFVLSASPIGETALYISGAGDYAGGSPRQSELQVLGVSSGSATFDYTVDKVQSKIILLSGSTAGSGTNNMLVRYVGTVPVPVHMDNATSIEEFGRHARTIQLTDVITVLDTESRTVSVLDKFSQPFQSAVLEVQQIDGKKYDVGDAIQVSDLVNNPTVSGVFTIFGVTLKYPSATDVVKVGDRQFESPDALINISERTHRLERELISSGAVLTELVRQTADLELVPDQLILITEYINDSFLTGHPINGIVYDPTETTTIDDFESIANWSEGTGSETLTITGENSGATFWVGTSGVRAFWASSTGSGVLQNTESQGDFTNIISGTTGTPVSGTAGVWVHSVSGQAISGVPLLRIGSSSSDFHDYLGSQYANVVGGFESSNYLTSGARTLCLYNLPSPDSSTGTVDWTAIDFIQLRWDILTSGSLVFDYLTASRSNTISQTGLGSRFTTKLSGTTVY